MRRHEVRNAGRVAQWTQTEKRNLTIQQNDRLKYSPASGSKYLNSDYPRTAAEYRDEFPSAVWYYNPWTGEKRTVEDDPSGVRIVLAPPPETMKEACATTDQPTITVHPDTKETNPKDAIGDTKVPLALLSPIASAHWALAQFARQVKYGAWNWRPAGVRLTVYTSAIKRHVAAYESGEEYDPDDETHHLGNIMACCAVLLEAKARGNLVDDRGPAMDVRPTYKFVMEKMKVLREKYKDKNVKHWTINDTEA